MVGVSDFDGVLRGKHVLGEDLSDGDKVIKFSEAVLAWDCTDRVIPASFTQKPLSAFGDADLRILSGTGRSVSHLGSQYLYLAEFTGAHENICPRGVLRKVLRRAADHGYDCTAGFEFEFILFKENADTIEEKPFGEWAPLTRGPFGYSIARSSRNMSCSVRSWRFVRRLEYLSADYTLKRDLAWSKRHFVIVMRWKPPIEQPYSSR
ncbi:hypothetical protein ACQ5SK_29345 [Bradyrhizobium japonicum]